MIRRSRTAWSCSTRSAACCTKSGWKGRRASTSDASRRTTPPRPHWGSWQVSTHLGQHSTRWGNMSHKPFLPFHTPFFPQDTGPPHLTSSIYCLGPPTPPLLPCRPQLRLEPQLQARAEQLPGRPTCGAPGPLAVALCGRAPPPRTVPQEDAGSARVHRQGEAFLQLGRGDSVRMWLCHQTDRTQVIRKDLPGRCETKDLIVS